MKVLLLHPGTQHSPQLARLLNEMGLLYKYYTCFAYTRKSGWSLLAGLSRKMRQRELKGIEEAQLRTFPLLELQALWQVRKGVRPEQVFIERNRRFQRAITDSELKKADVVIGFDTASWDIARRCKKIGKKFIMEATIGHPVSKRNILEEVYLQNSIWEVNSEGLIFPGIALEEEEISLAGKIVVPSHFVRSTYIKNGVPEAKILLNPFGTDIGQFKPALKRRDDNKPIRFLFFGSLSARKGLPLLLDAWKEIDPLKATLTIAGFGNIPQEVDVRPEVNIAGPILRSDRQRLFDAHDVFIFPSYFEGFALVQIEAAACGLPLISTFNAGGEGLLKDGENGYLIPAGSRAGLLEAIQSLIANPAKISSMSIASRRIAEKFTWEAYGLRWQRILNDTINE